MYYDDGSFIACNVIGMLFIAIPVMNSPTLARGKSNKDAKASLAEMHRAQYGIELGMPDGDRFDAAQCTICFLVYNLCWAPYGWAQALSIMATIWAGLALTAISAHTFAPRSPPEVLGGSLVITAVLFFIGQTLVMVIVPWRIVLTLLSVTEYYYLFLGWTLLCIGIHAKFMLNFHKAALLPGSQWIYAVSTKMNIFVTAMSPTGEWEAYAPCPKGFDFAADGPRLDPETLEEMKLPASPDHETLVKYYNKFMEENTCSPGVCIGSFILVLAIGLGAWAATSAAADQF